jgi:hypothetical protein
MDRETEAILSQAEAARRQRRKTEDRAEKFRNAQEVKELVERTHRQLEEIKRAVADCDPLFQRAAGLALDKQSVDCRSWMLDYEQNKSKMLSIPSAIEWIQNLSDADFSHYSAAYPFENLIHDFITDFLNDKNGDGRGVAQGIREKHGLLEDWIKRNPKALGAESTAVPPVFPEPKGPPHRTLNNLDQ